MDRIELAQRRFQQILPEARTPWQGRQVREVGVWLREDVVTAVEEFVTRPDFRAHATWPLRRLVAGSGSDERRAVDAVDGALVDSAAALARLAELRPVATALVDTNPPRERPAPTVVVIGGDDPPAPARTSQYVDELVRPWNQVKNISGRNWTDLVCAADYLLPRGGMMLKTPPPAGATEGLFVVSLNPELRLPGDFVTSCMFQRIGAWSQCLAEFRRLCYRAWEHAGRPGPGPARAEQEAWRDLSSREARLRTLCRTGRDAALRDSCVILTQAYGAFHPSPDLAWLGLPPGLMESDLAVLRDRITGSGTPGPVERVAAALADLRRLAPSAPRRDGRDAAIDAGGLVLVGRPRAAYWMGRRLDADWDANPKAWEFLLALAVRAPRSAAVGEADLYAEPVGRSTMANRHRRLKVLLPPTLWKWILPAGPRAYRLDLDRTRVHLFDAE